MKNKSAAQNKNESLWKRRIWWVFVGGMATLSTVRVFISAFEAPAGSQLRYSLFGVLGILTGMLVVLITFCLLSAPGKSRLRKAQVEFPGALFIVHADLAEGSYDTIHTLGATPFKNHAVVNQTLCFTSDGLTVYRGLGKKIFFLPSTNILAARLVRGTLSTGASSWVFQFRTLQDAAEHNLEFAFNDKKALFSFFPPPSHRKYAGILTEIQETLNLTSPRTEGQDS